MTDESGWRPLQEPTAGREGFEVTRFTRLARVHALAVATDTLIATALAGSLFFSIPTGEARDKVTLYLVLTMAPFAVVAPFIGPLLDRAKGGRRWMVIGTSAGRAVVCAFMVDDINSLLLFPEAFVVLVLAKAYTVAKSALVPTVVDDDDALVEANSRLSLISGVIGFVAAVPGIIFLQLGGPQWTVGLAGLAAAGAAVLGLRLPNAPVATSPPDAAEQVELRGLGILLASSAMGLLRGIVGFLTFLLAFDLRGGGGDGPVPTGYELGRSVREAGGFELPSIESAGGHPAWHFGLVLAASLAGSLGGAIVAPRLRQMMGEERILLGALGVTAVAGLAAAVQSGIGGAMLLAGVVGASASSGKLAFDAIVQRDAPDANRGRSFARFETRFQLIWVIGAFVPVVLPLPARLGYLVVAACATFAFASYLTGNRATSAAAVAATPDGLRAKWRKRRSTPPRSSTAPTSPSSATSSSAASSSGVPSIELLVKDPAPRRSEPEPVTRELDDDEAELSPPTWRDDLDR